MINLLINPPSDHSSSLISRYCELCGLAANIERGLSQGEHAFLPELAAGQEAAFAPKCGQIGAQTYEFKRTIDLPGRKALEQKVRQRISGVDAEIRKRLNKGVGPRGIWLNSVLGKAPARSLSKNF